MPGVSAGDAYLSVHPELAASFGRRLSAQVQTPAARAGQEASRHFARKFAAGLAIGGAAIGVGLYKATKLAARGIQATTDAASALNEQVNKSNAIFGSSSKEIQRWAAGARNNIGQSRTQALTAASAFGDMFLQLKLGQRPATTMSKRMVELASDLASFSDADITQVLEAQQSAFRGEYDALQRFIPNINAARVEQEALRATHKKSAKDLTAAEKAQATYNIIMRDSARAHGDYGRTLQTSVANQNRKAKAQWEDLKVTLGKGFLPAQLAITRAFTEKLLPAGMLFVRELAPGISTTATAIASSLAGAVPPAGELAETARHLGERLSELGPDLGARVGEGVGRLFDLLERLGPELRNTNVQASDLGPTLRLSGAAFGFIADHADLLARNIGLVAAGFVVYKGVQAAAQAADVARVALLPVQIAGNFTLARSNRALVASLGEREAATVTVTAVEGTATAQTVAWGTATTATATKLQLLTTGLGLFGAALAVGEIVDRLTSRLGRFQKVTEFALGGVGLFGVAVGGLKESWRAMTGAQDAAAASTGAATTAAGRHTAALIGERLAVDALRGALAGEKTAELDLRQAKLNVSAAQQRLTELKGQGKTKSLEYKQAQIDLERAQIDLRAKTDDYKAAQAKANAATGGAMHAAQLAQPPLKRLGDTAKTGGDRASDARIPWRKLGEDVASTYREIHSKTADIIAKFTWSGLEVFRVGRKGQTSLAFAKGGPITRLGETALVGEEGPELVRFTRPGYVYTASETRDLQRRGLADGGPVGRIPTFAMKGDRGFTNALGDWDLRVEKVLNLAARAFGNTVKGMTARPPHVPGGWRVALQFLSALGIPYNVISTYRPGAVTHASGRQSYHALNRAVDLTGDRPRIFAALSRTDPTELIDSHEAYYIARGRRKPIGQLDRITYADHLGHLHAAYDQGGWLPPGTSLATNRTGRPERVTPADQPLLSAREARMIGRAVADELVHAGMGAVNIDSRRVEQLLAGARISNARR